MDEENHVYKDDEAKEKNEWHVVTEISHVEVLWKLLLQFLLPGLFGGRLWWNKPFPYNHFVKQKSFGNLGGKTPKTPNSKQGIKQD